MIIVVLEWINTGERGSMTFSVQRDHIYFDILNVIQDYVTKQNIIYS